jgi:general secretion pathway protein G
MQPETNGKTRVTWIEVVMVTVVLVVLAALVTPQFSQAGRDPREQKLHLAVQVVRGQIEMYRLQHEKRYPALEGFAEQMTAVTNGQGEIGEPGEAGFQFGPYLREIPVNPYCGTNSVSNGPGGTSAWYYDPDSGEFRPNHMHLR